LQKIGCKRSISYAGAEKSCSIAAAKKKAVQIRSGNMLFDRERMNEGCAPAIWIQFGEGIDIVWIFRQF